MKNAQPTSRDKGIKEGRLDFTTPPLQISHTQIHTKSFNIHPLTLSQNTQPSTHIPTHSANKKTATWTRYSTHVSTKWLNLLTENYPVASQKTERGKLGWSGAIQAACHTEGGGADGVEGDVYKLSVFKIRV